MSCIESKTVFRAEIPSLRGLGKKEALSYFKKIIGQPDELDEDNEDIYYFDYIGRFKPVHDYHNRRWGIDLVIAYSNDYRIYIENNHSKGISLSEFKSMAEELATKFNLDVKDVRFLSYSWSNRGDEPIYLKWE